MPRRATLALNAQDVLDSGYVLLLVPGSVLIAVLGAGIYGHARRRRAKKPE